MACLAGLALLITLFAHAVRLHWFDVPLLALVLGVLIGPHGMGWLNLSAYGEEQHVLQVVARYTLVTAVVMAGIELRGFLTRQWQPLTVLFLGGTVLMWGAGSLLVGTILGLGLLPALMIGAVLTPTDPILTATVASGRIPDSVLPTRIRHLLAAESAARQGAGLVMVLLPILLITQTRDGAWWQWVSDALLWKGVAAVVIGAVVGYWVGRALKWSTDRDSSETATGPLAAIFLALAFALASVVQALGSDGTLAVLVAGVTFAWGRADDDAGDELFHQHRAFQQLHKQVLVVPIFALLGAALPWGQWAELGWKAPVIVVAVLALRRIPAVLIMKPFVKSIRGWDDALFVGWFGPIGVSALYFASVAHLETQDEHVWAVTTLLIAATIVLHDTTTTPLSQWLGRRYPDDD